MFTDASTRAVAGCFLSVRSSCDRCRVQKLKCSVPTGSGACERCTRAKLSCVFGRRTPSKRQLTNDERQTTTNLPPTRTTSPTIQGAPLTPFNSLPTPTSTSASTSTLTSTSTTAPQGELLPESSPYLQLVGPIEPVPTLAPASELEFDSYDIRTWDNLTLGLHNVLECESDIGSFGWTQSGFNMDDVNMFDSGQLELPRWPSQIAGLMATNGPMDVTATASNQGNINISTAVLTSQRLISLVSEIQQRLRKLEEGPWHADSARSLDDYPVGTVLQLSQQFGAIASLVLNTTYVAVGAMMPYREEEDGRTRTAEGSEDGGANDDDYDERKTSGAVLDAPTILLLLSGYMMLVRIFDVVLGHFQKHLNRMPSNFNCGGNCSSSMTAAAGRTLRLGELPFANAALGLQKIHMAVSMLLDALHEIEGHLGRGGTVVRDLAVTLLLNNSGKRQDDSCSGLSRRAIAVKELLREKMGL